jgi:hypothetical protein
LGEGLIWCATHLDKLDSRLLVVHLKSNAIFVAINPVRKEATMKQQKIIEELTKLPESEILFIMEKTLHIVREKFDKSETEKKQQLKAAAKALYDDYANDEELTVFTALDSEAFHE